MSQRAVYASTALANTNKAGVLKPDADGYFTVVLGALDVYNSAGAFYPFESAKEVFKASSSLMRRIANGACRAEYGHPKMLPGMSQRDFLSRIMTIYEENVCAHIKEVVIDYSSLKDEHGKPIIAIIGKVKPMGPRGPDLLASLQNPNENVCFSVRSLTDDVYVGGVLRKHIRSIVTWDYVNEPGIKVANKFASPALENFDEVSFTVAHLGSVRDFQHASGVSLESTGGIGAEEIMNDFGWTKSKDASLPPSMRW